jgi:hypothetical protein
VGNSTLIVFGIGKIKGRWCKPATPLEMEPNPMRVLHKKPASSRELRKSHIISPTAAANEVRKIQAGLSDMSLKFNEIALGVTDSRRARKLSALALLTERAACPLSKVAADLERVRL